jgi:hypothetical protein
MITQADARKGEPAMYACIRHQSRSVNPAELYPRSTSMSRPIGSCVVVLLLAVVSLSGCRDDAPSAAADSQHVALRVAQLDPDIPSVNVDRLLRNPNDHTGTMAVEGVVVQCFEERGAFVVVDEEEFRTCGLEACTDAAMPVRFARDQFEGSPPQPGQRVTLVGRFEPLERGFQFDLYEVHRDGAVILAQRLREGG